jgi:hypothetical protein
MMEPVARGIAGGLLLSLALVAGLALLPGVGPSEGSAQSADKVYFVASVTTTISTTSTTTTGTASTAGPPSLNAALSAATATISSAQPKSSYSVLLTFLPVAAALALGASAYLISRSRIEKEA